MKPALLEMPAVFEAIICPYAPKIGKNDFYVMFFVKSNDFKEPNWIIFILLDFLCNFLMTRFIHFSGLLNPGKSLPPAIRSAKDMNTEKHEFD